MQTRRSQIAEQHLENGPKYSDPIQSVRSSVVRERDPEAPDKHAAVGGGGGGNKLTGGAGAGAAAVPPPLKLTTTSTLH